MCVVFNKTNNHKPLGVVEYITFTVQTELLLFSHIHSFTFFFYILAYIKETQSQHFNIHKEKTFHLNGFLPHIHVQVEFFHIL